MSIAKSPLPMVGMVALCLGMMPSPLLAQKPGKEGARERSQQSSRGSGPRNLMQNFPVLAALDADGNNEISAAEIAAASAALKTLDKNKDGKLSGDELRPRFANRPSAREGGGSVPSPPISPSARSGGAPPETSEIGGAAPMKIVRMFGVRGIKGVPDHVLSSYRRVFGFTDSNKDGRHSRKEYIDEGRHLTREVRAGIFKASDTNRDDFVSEQEYVENRVITDQAKELFSSMDGDDDGRLTGEEIVDSGKLKDAKLALAVFAELDANSDELLLLPEFLYKLGRWARSREEVKERK